MLSLISDRCNFVSIFFTLLSISVAIVSPVKAQIPNSLGQTTPSSSPQENVNISQNTTTTEENNRSLSQSNSLLSLQGGQKLMAEADAAINNQQYDTAVDKLQKARQIFNQLSNFYLELAASFSGIDNSIAENQKRQALEAGQLRDRATYQLALVHRAQTKPELAVPLLIQVIKSQNPTSDLGKKSYQQLLEMGFVSTPFPATNPAPSGAGNGGSTKTK
jgi:hypothetical protein